MKMLSSRLVNKASLVCRKLDDIGTRLPKIRVARLAAEMFFGVPLQKDARSASMAVFAFSILEAFKNGGMDADSMSISLKHICASKPDEIDCNTYVVQLENTPIWYGTMADAEKEADDLAARGGRWSRRIRVRK